MQTSYQIVGALAICVTLSATAATEGTGRDRISAASDTSFFGVGRIDAKLRSRRPVVSSAAAAPKTQLGRELLAIRQRALARGERMLSWDEIHQQISQRRGEDT